MAGCFKTVRSRICNYRFALMIPNNFILKAGLVLALVPWVSGTPSLN